MRTIKKTGFFLLVLFSLSCMGEAQNRKNGPEVNITQFNVYEKHNEIFIEWATDAAVATNYWEVQRSTDGKEFSTIALVLGPDPGKPGDTYRYKEQVGKGRHPGNYYRLCHVATDGTRQISEINQPAK